MNIAVIVQLILVAYIAGSLLWRIKRAFDDADRRADIAIGVTHVLWDDGSVVPKVS